MGVTIQRLSIPSDRRVLVTSDIHGHADLLRQVLAQAKFSPDDVLIIVGDMLEKGRQSLETLRLVMELCRTHTVYPLMGNVDQFRLDGLMGDDPAVRGAFIGWSRHAMQWWGGSWFQEMCDELHISCSEGNEDAAILAVRRHFGAEIAFLQSLPTILETPDAIFVHGGIPHERLDEFVGQDCYTFLKYDHFMERCPAFCKWVVVGHWPVVLYAKDAPSSNPIADESRHVLSIDGGCGVKRSGQLNLLCLPGGRVPGYTHWAADELPAVTAREGQAARASSYYIHWGDHHVTVLERQAHFSRVLFHDKEAWVPTQYLYRDDTGDCCTDVTDYLLPIQPGDELKVILALPEGIYTKCRGTFGWYFGRYDASRP